MRRPRLLIHSYEIGKISFDGNHVNNNLFKDIFGETVKVDSSKGIPINGDLNEIVDFYLVGYVGPEYKMQPETYGLINNVRELNSKAYIVAINDCGLFKNEQLIGSGANEVVSNGVNLTMIADANSCILKPTKFYFNVLEIVERLREEISIYKSI